jgi:hypothetical protein
VRVAALLLALVLGGGVARAAEPAPFAPKLDPEAPAPHEAPQRWYGWQILAADAVTAGIWVGAVRSHDRSTPLVALGAVPWLLAPPLIHVLHERRSAAGRSLLTRLAAPMIGALGVLFVETQVCGDVVDGGYFYSDCQRQGALAALAVPMLAASIYDIVTAWTARPMAQPDDAWPRRPPPSVAWSPTVAPSQNGASVGFVGTF